MARRTPRSSAARALERRVTHLVTRYVRASAARRNPRRATRPQHHTRTLREALDEFLSEFVLAALLRRRVGRRWNVQGTARDLDIDRGRLQRLIDRLELRPPRRVRVAARRKAK